MLASEAVAHAMAVTVGARIALRVIALTATALAVAGSVAAAAGGASANQRGGAVAAAIRQVIAMTAALTAFSVFGRSVAGGETALAAGTATGMQTAAGVEALLSRMHTGALATLSATFATAGIAERANTAISSTLIGVLVGGVLSPLAMRLEWGTTGASFAPSGDKHGVIDLAGTGPCHVVAGAAALACALLAGPRVDSKGQRRFEPVVGSSRRGSARAEPAAAAEEGRAGAQPKAVHMPPMPPKMAGLPFGNGWDSHDEALSGLGGLMTSWGLSLSAVGAAPWALISGSEMLGRTLTCLTLAPAAAAAMAAATAVVLSIRRGYGATLATSTCVRGCIAGAAAVAAAGPVVSPGASIAIGGVAGVFFTLAVFMMAAARVDDVMDVVAAHLVGGGTGMLMGSLVAQRELVVIIHGDGSEGVSLGSRLGLAFGTLVGVSAITFAGMSLLFLPNLITRIAAMPPRRRDYSENLGSISHASSQESMEKSSTSSNISDDLVQGALDKSLLTAGPFERVEMLKFVTNLRSLSFIGQRTLQDKQKRVRRAVGERDGGEGSGRDGDVDRAANGRKGSPQETQEDISDSGLDGVIDVQLLNGIEPLYDFLSAPLSITDEALHQVEQAWVIIKDRWNKTLTKVCGRPTTKLRKRKVRFAVPQKQWAMELAPASVRAKGEDKYLILPTNDSTDAPGAMTNAQWRGSALGDAQLVCVFDGHGGMGGATLARERFPWALLSALPKSKNKMTIKEALPRALATAMQDISDQIKESEVLAGCTGTAVIIRDGVVTTANVGDSRCLASVSMAPDFAEMGCSIFPGAAFTKPKNAQARLTMDHRMDDSGAEVKRLTDAGVVVSRLIERTSGVEVGPLRAWPGGLAVSRSLGDGKAAEAVCAVPYVTRFDLNQLPPDVGQVYMTVASDGIWDALKDSEVVKVVMKAKTPGRAARRLGYLATVRRRLSQKPDDITAICVNFSRATLEGEELRAAQETGAFAEYLDQAIIVLADK